MKKLLFAISLTILASLLLTGFARMQEGEPLIEGEAEEPEPILLLEEMPAILSQLIVIFSTSGIGVLLGNIAKNFKQFKWMDGKTDRIVAIVVTVLFGVTIYLKIFNRDLFLQLMPWLEANVAKYIEYANIVFGWVLVILGLQPIHAMLSGKPIVGKSFNK